MVLLAAVLTIPLCLSPTCRYSAWTSQLAAKVTTFPKQPCLTQHKNLLFTCAPVTCSFICTTLMFPQTGMFANVLANGRYSAWTSQLGAKVAAAAKSLAVKLPAPTRAPAAAPAAGYKGMDYYSALGVLRRVLEEGRAKGLPPPVVVSEGANTMVSALFGGVLGKEGAWPCVSDIPRRGVATRACPHPWLCLRAPTSW